MEWGAGSHLGNRLRPLWGWRDVLVGCDLGRNLGRLRVVRLLHDPGGTGVRQKVGELVQEVLVVRKQR